MYRIGELARRTGTSADLLRAWERRYGLLRPERTPGGFRVYTEHDAARVERMQSALGRGIAAAEAARFALLETPEPRFLDALLALSDERAQAILDEAFGRLSLDAALSEVVLPALREIGRGWDTGAVSIAQEHYAANLIRARLLSLARGWDRGGGPRALLACAPGDAHDLPLICFGLVLRDHGWRILFLGTDTPFDVVADTAASEAPYLVVIASAQRRAELADPALARIAALAPLALAGPWPETDVPTLRLEGDPVALAASVGATR